MRRLLARPLAAPVLVSLPTDQLIDRAPTPRPPRTYLRVKVGAERVMVLAVTRGRRAAARARRAARAIVTAWRR